ncbi:uncharacterized protein METZ01_LOCUS217857, partial [marine metagenome]
VHDKIQLISKIQLNLNENLTPYGTFNGVYQHTKRLTLILIYFLNYS